MMSRQTGPGRERKGGEEEALAGRDRGLGLGLWPRAAASAPASASPATSAGQDAAPSTAPLLPLPSVAETGIASAARMAL